jgi:hypothetical protein
LGCPTAPEQDGIELVIQVPRREDFAGRKRSPPMSTGATRHRKPSGRATSASTSRLSAILRADPVAGHDAQQSNRPPRHHRRSERRLPLIVTAGHLS